MPVHFTPAHKYDTVLDKGGGLRHFCSVECLQSHYCGAAEEIKKESPLFP